MTMSFAQRYVVLVHVTLLGSQSVFIASAPTFGPILPTMDQRLMQTKHADYTYTSGVGAHKVHSRTAIWNTARRICDEQGGHLAIINSIAEAEAVAQLLNDSNAGEGFVGVHDLYGEDDFVTIHGDPLARTGYDTWAAGEPNNANHAEHCVVINTEGKLNDAACDNRSHFVCEMPYILSYALGDSANLNENITTTSQLVSSN